MKVLFVLFRSLGDVCMGTTVIHTLKQQNPDMIIDVATEKQNVNTLEGNPDINEIHVLDNYFESMLLYMDGKYDKIFKVNMVNHLETRWHHLSELQNQHLVEWYAKKCGIDVLEDKNIYIYPSEKDEKIVSEETYKAFGNLSEEFFHEKVIAIHTTSGSHRIPGTDQYQRVDSKDWPIDYFQVLADRLVRKGYTVCQVGAASDKKIELDKVVDLRGKFSFKQTAVFFKKCHAYVGVDSGPAYLASDWANIPSLILMGSTQSYLYTKINGGPSVGPRSKNAYFIDAIKPNNENCGPITPCYTHCIIGHNNGKGCIADISTDQVFNKFMEILENKYKEKISQNY
jgi:ADP-heptose:LPS heptosyltransferase